MSSLLRLPSLTLCDHAQYWCAGRGFFQPAGPAFMKLFGPPQPIPANKVKFPYPPQPDPQVMRQPIMIQLSNCPAISLQHRISHTHARGLAHVAGEVSIHKQTSYIVCRYKVFHCTLTSNLNGLYMCNILNEPSLTEFNATVMLECISFLFLWRCVELVMRRAVRSAVWLMHQFNSTLLQIYELTCFE